MCWPSGRRGLSVPATAENAAPFGNDRGRLAGVDPSRPGGRADLDALPAAGAAVENLAYPNVESGDKGVSAVGHVFPPNHTENSKECSLPSCASLPLRQQQLAADDYYVEGDIFKNVRLCQLDVREAILKSVRSP